jgi:hypothetical protein
MGIVYGLIDPAADTQWVRIGRGYLGNDNALVSTGQEDSVYYQQLSATLYLLGTNNDTLSSCSLIEDRTTRPLNAEGPFNREDYRLYRTDGHWKALPGKTCILEVNILDAPSYTMRAQTTIIESEDNFVNGRLGLIDIVEPKTNSPLQQGGIAYFQDYIRWEASSAFSFAPTFTQYYKEIDTSTREEVMHSYTIELPPVTSSKSIVRLEELKKAMLDNVSINPNVVRFFDAIQIEVTAVDGTLDTYQKQRERDNRQGPGLYSYTNIENGLGVFASRTTVYKYPVFLSKENETRLANSSDICPLNFARSLSSGDTVICVPGVNGVGFEQLFSFN